MFLPFVCQSGQEGWLRERAMLMLLPKNVLMEWEGQGGFMFHVKSAKTMGFLLPVFPIPSHLKM